MASFIQSNETISIEAKEFFIYYTVLQVKIAWHRNKACKWMKTGSRLQGSLRKVTQTTC